MVTEPAEIASATRADELRAASDAIGGGLAHTAALAGNTHAAIATRTFAAIGPLGAPARAVHDQIAPAVYRHAGRLLRQAARRGGAALAQQSAGDAPLITAGAAGSRAAAVVGGLWGDHLQTGNSALALPTEIRVDGRSVTPERDALTRAFPSATDRVAVLVHGLMESDEAWLGVRARRASRPRTPYAPQLRELGITPVTLRYNTGLTVAENGVRLASLLEALRAAWPQELADLTLIGHSMGGLVARSALHTAASEGHTWGPLTRHAFYLGSPHLGADLERGAELLSRTLRWFPESRAFGDTIGARSAGIRDLHDGFDSAALPLASHVSHHAIVATLSNGRAGQLLGDLLVREPSASGAGRGRTVDFDGAQVTRLPGLNHFDLLDHPAVFDVLAGALAPAAAARR